jgi:hypothetical protein
VSDARAILSANHTSFSISDWTTIYFTFQATLKYAKYDPDSSAYKETKRKPIITAYLSTEHISFKST